MFCFVLFLKFYLLTGNKINLFKFMSFLITLDSFFFTILLDFSQFSAVTQLCTTLCDPHGLQHIRLPCPSPTPGACSNSCPSSQWCHPIVSSSIFPFSSCLQSFPASGSFASGGQSTGVSRQHQSFSEYSGLISITVDWFDLLAVQGNLKSLL